MNTTLLRTSSQIKSLRLFSTTTRLHRGIVEPKDKGQPVDIDSIESSQAQTKMQSKTQSKIQHDTAPTTTATLPTSVEENQDLALGESSGIYHVLSLLEDELDVYQNHLQALISQLDNESKPSPTIDGQTKDDEALIHSTRFQDVGTGRSIRLKETNPRLTRLDSQAEMTHLDHTSAVHMVSVSNKPITKRTATAIGSISLSREAFDAITAHSLKKGDVLSVARIAAIQAVKRTSDLIPLCHPGLPIEGIKVDIKLVQPGSIVSSEEQTDSPLRFLETPKQRGRLLKMAVTVESSGKTGIEMEALTGVTAGLLTVYDMCKSIDKQMDIRASLWSKAGGKSGKWKNRISGNYKPRKNFRI